MEATRTAHQVAGPHLPDPSSSSDQALRKASQNLLQGQKVTRSGKQGQGNEKWIFRCLLSDVLWILSIDTNWLLSQAEQLLWTVPSDSGDLQMCLTSPSPLDWSPVAPTTTCAHN